MTDLLACISVGGSRKWVWLADTSGFSIRPCARKGLAAFSLRRFEAGQIILVEKPLARWYQQVEHSREDNLAALHKCVSALDSKSREKFDALMQAPVHGKDRSVLGIFLSNSFACGEAVVGKQVVSSSLHTNFSRINHACRPNTQHLWHEEAGVRVLRAARCIAPGDELTIAYTEEGVCDGRTAV